MSNLHQAAAAAHTPEPAIPTVSSAQEGPMAIDRNARVCVVVNPSANQGDAQQSWTQVAPRLRSHFPQLQESTTAGPGQAGLMARQALESGAKMVIAFGGDGTVNEVLNGFIDQKGNNEFPDAALGILAAGSGSDFQRQFGRLSPHEQLAKFLQATPQIVDYGVAQYRGRDQQETLRAFLNIASVGISGDVLHHLDRQEGEGSARMRYLKATLSAIAGLRNHQTRVTLQDSEGDSKARTVDLTLASIANGRFFGSGMQISPHSRIDDGQLRVLTASVPTRVRLLALLAKVYGGKHLGSKSVHYQASALAELCPVDPKREVRLELDGEMVGHLPGRFSLRPSALRVLIAGSKH